MRGHWLIVGVLSVGLASAACSGAQGLAAASTGDTGSADQPGGEAQPDGRVLPASSSRSEWREITIPAGTSLPIVLDTTVGSATSRVEQPVEAHVARAVLVHGETALPVGSRVTGIVTDATRSGRVKGRAHVAMRFESVVPRGEDARYEIRTTAVGRTAKSTKKKDAAEIGAPAAGGALIGALVGGGKGALIGTAAGGGAGTAVVLSTRGKEVSLPRGTALTLRLVEPLTIKIRR